MYPGGPGGLYIIVYGVTLLLAVNGVRGTFARRTFPRQPPTSNAVSP